MSTLASGPGRDELMPRCDLETLLGFALSDEQWQCVSAPLEPFVIVAGAGTGKTAVMAARVVWLVASGRVAEHEVLGLTFTNKAAAELAARVTALLNAWRLTRGADRGDVPGEPTIATYHSFARRLIDEQGLRAGIEPGARLLSGPAVAQLAYRVVCRTRKLTATRHVSSRVAGDLLRLDANLAEQTISTADLRDHERRVIADIDDLPRATQEAKRIRGTCERRLELADLVDDLRTARREAGGLDFADHMRLCAELVRSSPELVATMRQAFRVILLDEYQDTSIAQRVILSTLFAGHAVTAVGDPMQAIYGWRSASVANIDSFASHFGAGGVAPIRVLSVNRRSGTPILAAANHIAAGLRSRHPQIAELRPPQPCRGQVRAALLPTVLAEQQWLVDQVEQLVRSGTPAADIAILGRANDQLAPLQRMLLARGVPASISGTAALTTSPYAMAVLATLRVLNDPADNTSVAALLTGQRWRIGPRDLVELGSRADQIVGARRPTTEPTQGRGRLRERLSAVSAVEDPVQRPSLLEAAADPGDRISTSCAERLSQFVAELDALQAHVGAPLPDLVAAVVTVTGARVEADLAAGHDGLGDVGLAGLLHLVEDFSDATGRTGLGALLSYLDAAEEMGTEEDVDLPTMPGAVQLMTMHKAKGLEFGVVVLPHLCRDSFPGGKPSERWTGFAHVVPSELRDDRHVLPALTGYSTEQLKGFVAACREHDRTGDDRLAYVAVTRAKRVLIASGHWWGATQKKPKGPSAYLQALRELSTQTDVDPWADPPADCAETGGANPMLEQVDEVAWPMPARGRVAEAARAVAAWSAGGRPRPEPWSTSAHAAPEPVAGPDDPVTRQVAQWDAGILALLARTSRAPEEHPVATLPGVLSASATLDLAADQEAFARHLLRPMPRQRNRNAELGTAFHAWVEARLGVQPLITDEELPGAADESIGSPEELAALKQSFEKLDYARRTPTGLEVPFALSIGGRLIRGRIDAVFPAASDAAPGQLWEVVDWKTSRHDEADALQLAIYRLAWAQRVNVPVEAVGAAFAFVRSGTVQRPAELASAAQIEQLLSGA